MENTISSKNGIVIRLTHERWKHIALMYPAFTDRKKQVLKTVKDPSYILAGKAGELLAVSGPSKRVYLVVVYKETGEDGFIITAFETTDTTWLFKKEIIWSKDL